MGAVDVHAHYLPAALLDALRARSAAPRLILGEPVLVDCGDGLAYPLFPGLEGPVARDGIDVTLWSVPPPGVAGLPDADAIAVAAACNDELASSGGLAVLPLATPEAAVAELERAAALGMAGASLPSNVDGGGLDGADFRPLFEAAASLSMPLVLHPALPVDRRFVAGYGLLTTLGFVYDESIAAARLVMSGVFERHPDLVLLLPHAGATLAPLLGRFDYELSLMGLDEQLSTPASEQLRLLHVDSICESPAALRLAIETFGIERVLYGSDEPYWSAERSRATVTALALDEADEQALLAGNAQRIFRLP